MLASERENVISPTQILSEINLTSATAAVQTVWFSLLAFRSSWLHSCYILHSVRTSVLILVELLRGLYGLISFTARRGVAQGSIFNPVLFCVRNVNVSPVAIMLQCEFGDAFLLSLWHSYLFTKTGLLLSGLLCLLFSLLFRDWSSCWLYRFQKRCILIKITCYNNMSL